MNDDGYGGDFSGVRHPLPADRTDTAQMTIVAPHPPVPGVGRAKLEPWSLGLVPLERSVFGRWRIYLYRGFVRYGRDGWGWSAYTLRGARRKGLRKLAAKEAAERRMERRRHVLRGEYR